MQKEEATVLSGCQDRPKVGRWWRATAMLAMAGALALSGCRSNTDSSGPSTATTAAKAQKVDEIAATVPEDIKKSGKLVVGVNIPYTPNEFKDPSGKIVGFDVDLMNAIASTLGLTADYREADFAKIIPSIQGGTFNVGMSSFTDTKEREQSVDFVDYFSAGTAWAKPKGSDIGPDNACGKKVAVQATTTQEVDELPARSKACTDAGKPAIEILKFDGQDEATNAVVLGQADAMSADSPVTRTRSSRATASSSRRVRSSIRRRTAGRSRRARHWRRRCRRLSSTSSRPVTTRRSHRTGASKPA